jgi:hypothetical protein
MEGGNGKERGGPSVAGDGSNGRHRPPANSGRVGQGDSGAWWAAAGCRRARQRDAALTRRTLPAVGGGGRK